MREMIRTGPIKRGVWWAPEQLLVAGIVRLLHASGHCNSYKAAHHLQQVFKAIRPICQQLGGTVNKAGQWINRQKSPRSGTASAYFFSCSKSRAAVPFGYYYGNRKGGSFRPLPAS
jgi:hypothetical protein